MLATLVLAGLAAAASPPDPPGQITCKQHTPNCGKKIRDTTIGDGETRRYEGGTWTVQGLITVESGGTLELEDATFEFTDGKTGILVHGGGTARFVRSTLREASTGSDFLVDVRAEAELLLNASTLRGGSGLVLAANRTEMTGNLFADIPLAIRLRDTAITVEANHFDGNDVSINQTGGENLITRNSFRGGTRCIENYETHPTITHNHLKGCHTGILHERSHSAISDNVIEDDGVPPGTGINVVDTKSPVIENNTISNYYYGVKVTNARAFIRNNSITDNVVDGVRVENNTGPMDIQGNLIARNGAHGILLVDVDDVEVFSNDVRENGGDGVRVEGASALLLHNNTVDANDGDGILLLDAPSVDVDDNAARHNGGTGIVVGAGSGAATLRRNDPDANGAHGVRVVADSVHLHENRADLNGVDGLHVEGAHKTRVFGGSAQGNGGSGYRFLDAVNVEMEDALATGNGEHGVNITGGGAHVLTRVNASENDLDGFHVRSIGTGYSQNRLDLPRALWNGRDGFLSITGNTTRIVDGWFEGNVNAGVENQDAGALIFAECAYWGHPDGPTTPDRPNRGDRVIGNVDFEPFRSAPPPGPCPAPPPDYYLA